MCWSARTARAWRCSSTPGCPSWSTIRVSTASFGGLGPPGPDVDLLRPFEFEFFVNGLFVATLAGALCGLIGVYVVLKGMSYIGHGLSHAIFGGFAASALLGVNFFLGAGAWGFAAAMMINGVTRRRAIGSDAAIGVITTASFAIGVALIKRDGSGGKHPASLRFGQILGVSDADVWLLAAVTLAAALVVFFLYRPLLFSTFDPEVAEVSGVATARVDALLTLVLAASILATMTVLGVTLVAATLVIPAVVEIGRASCRERVER